MTPDVLLGINSLYYSIQNSMMNRLSKLSFGFVLTEFHDFNNAKRVNMTNLAVLVLISSHLE